MKTIQVIIRQDAVGQEWVRPVGGHSTALFKFVTLGHIEVHRGVWEQDIEPVLKALGWWWGLA
jgi:hypothetical protein